MSRPALHGLSLLLVVAMALGTSVKGDRAVLSLAGPDVAVERSAIPAHPVNVQRVCRRASPERPGMSVRRAVAGAVVWVRPSGPAGEHAVASASAMLREAILALPPPAV